MNLQLKKISQSFYFSNYGTTDSGSAILNKLVNLDITKYEISEESRLFLMGVLDRKISSDMKADILKLINNGTIKIVLLDKSSGYPPFLNYLPMQINSKNFYLANIGYYAKFDLNTREVRDIDPRILFSILAGVYGLYKVINNTSKLLNDLKFQNVFITAYRKLFNRSINKIINLNTLTNDEKLKYDIILNIFINKRMLLKDTEQAEISTKTLMSNTHIPKEKIDTILRNMNINNIDDIGSLLDEMKSISPSFKKINSHQLMKEWLITLKISSVLSIDLIHFFIAMILSVYVGSSGIYNDNSIESILDSKEIDNIKVLVARV